MVRSQPVEVVVSQKKTQVLAEEMEISMDGVIVKRNLVPLAIDPVSIKMLLLQVMSVPPLKSTYIYIDKEGDIFREM